MGDGVVTVTLVGLGVIGLFVGGGVDATTGGLVGFGVVTTCCIVGLFVGLGVAIAGDGGSVTATPGGT